MINLESLLSGFAGNLNPAVAGSISVVIGLLALLFGYRLFRAYLFVVGFAVGTIAASAVTELTMALLCGLLAGLACIVLWYVGLFLLGAACGALLTLALGITFTPLVVAVAILFGILAVVIRKLMIIVSTSWTGAGMILGVVGPALGLRDPVGMLLATLALAAAGVVCQYLLTAGKVVLPAGAGAADATGGGTPPPGSGSAPTGGSPNGSQSCA